MSFFEKVTNAVKAGIKKAEEAEIKSRPARKKIGKKIGTMIENYDKAQNRFNSSEKSRSKPSATKSKYDNPKYRRKRR